MVRIHIFTRNRRCHTKNGFRSILMPMKMLTNRKQFAFINIPRFKEWS